jgi:hypothetical protein
MNRQCWISDHHKNAYVEHNPEERVTDHLHPPMWSLTFVNYSVMKGGAFHQQASFGLDRFICALVMRKTQLILS